MKTSLEPEDIEAIALALIERIKAYIAKIVKPVPKDEILDVDGLAEYLQVDASWIYKQVSLKNIPYYKLKKYPRFKKSEIDDWFNKMKRIPVPPLKMANKTRRPAD